MRIRHTRLASDLQLWQKMPRVVQAHSSSDGGGYSAPTDGGEQAIKNAVLESPADALKAQVAEVKAAAQSEGQALMAQFSALTDRLMPPASTLHPTNKAPMSGPAVLYQANPIEGLAAHSGALEVGFGIYSNPATEAPTDHPGGSQPPPTCKVCNDALATQRSGKRTFTDGWTEEVSTRTPITFLIF